MTDTWTIDALLSLCVAAAWAACGGFLWKRGPLDTLYCPSVIAAASGAALVLAGLFAEGLTARVGKLVLLDGLVLVSGLVLSHALARSALRRAVPPTARFK
jgi:multisubunit Na+/H+ antiporter MnhG subunit